MAVTRITPDTLAAVVRVFATHGCNGIVTAWVGLPKQVLQTPGRSVGTFKIQDMS